MAYYYGSQLAHSDRDRKVAKVQLSRCGFNRIIASASAKPGLLQNPFHVKRADASGFLLLSTHIDFPLSRVNTLPLQSSTNNMWLLDTKDHRLHGFIGSNVPLYAILSHTWGDEEVAFKDMIDLQTASKLKGWSKISACCRRALEDGHEWVWIDTCCIDKSSSAELLEAINSMWQYYKESEICYAYLADVPSHNDLIPVGQYFTDHDLNKSDPDTTEIRAALSASRWFTRGWTLQELLAPKKVLFIFQDWSPFGYRDDLATSISSITNIDKSYLTGSLTSSASVACKMSWASNRQTTRQEDIAYCLLGLFQINMPLLYGEGAKAFKRLQLEIIRTTTDQSIFAWKTSSSSISPSAHQAGEAQGILAESPSWFKETGHIRDSIHEKQQAFSPANITNAGILIRLPVGPFPKQLVDNPSIHQYEDDRGLKMIMLACSAPGARERDDHVSIFVRAKGVSVETDGTPARGLGHGNYISAAVRAYPDFVYTYMYSYGNPVTPIYLQY